MNTQAGAYQRGLTNLLREALGTAALCLIALLTSGCDRGSPNPPAAAVSSPPKTAAPPPTPARVAGEIELVFPYGSEKKSWLEEVTTQFNNSGAKIADGRRIRVKPIAMGSGELMTEILDGRVQAHLASPASNAFLVLGNAEARARNGRDLVGPTQNLVLSPVVIAMWKPMAEAIGWGTKPVGWGDVLALAADEKGWAGRGNPQWGKFRFGHTHPEYSNSGLISVLAEVYAATGKVNALGVADVQQPKTGDYLRQIENAVVHYGSSTGFFGTKMFTNGPSYLSAAVLYENMVIESYNAKTPPVLPVVAIYPREGTFWSDHPIGVVERDWVTPAHREAAKKYIEFLLARPQQERAMAHGFRPGDVAVPLAAPIDKEHGVDPAEPQTTLEVPAADVMNAAIELWKKNKKHADVVLVLDTSGSMKQEDRIVHARAGAADLVRLLGDEDRLTLLTFSNTLVWSHRNVPMAAQREAVLKTVESLFPDGGTALYDSVAQAHAALGSTQGEGRIAAVVVLTDGQDTDSKTKLETLLAQIKLDPERGGVRVFTIGYGSGANKQVLQSIADTTQGKFYEGTAKNIREVFKDIATFF